MAVPIRSSSSCVGSRHSALLSRSAGAEPIELEDVAYWKHTRQSSVAQAHGTPTFAPWMHATDVEDEAWWEVDLLRCMYIDHVVLDTPDEVRVCVYSPQTPAGEPPAGCWQTVSREGAIAVGAVGRYVRIRRMSKGALKINAMEIRGASLFGPSLGDTWARIFTLFRKRELFDDMTYGEVWAQARRFAASLEKPHSNAAFLGICTRNRPEWVIADLACVMLGWTVVPLAPTDPFERIAEIVRRCNVNVVLCEQALE